jgi:hypothetical protein
MIAKGGNRFSGRSRARNARFLPGPRERRVYCPVFTSVQTRVTSRCVRGSFGVVV